MIQRERVEFARITPRKALTAERTRRDQPRGKGILGGSVRPAMKASGKRIWVDLFRG